MTCLIRDLFKEYNINDEIIPPKILDIILEEDIKHFSKGYLQNSIVTFKGEYNPDWMDDKKALLEVECVIDLKDYTKKLITASIEFTNGDEPSVEITNEVFTKFLNTEVVKFTQTIKDNFTNYTSYNILGGVVIDS